MAILNFDYKIKAMIKPIVQRYFTFQIYADVVHTNGTQRNEKVYEEQVSISSWNDSLNAAKTLTDLTVKELAQAGVDTLLVSDPQLTLNGYLVLSADPYVSVISSPDGSDQPLAWSNDLVQAEIAVETKWMIGPQVDTSINDTASRSIPVTDVNVKDLIIRNATIPLPKDFDVVSIQVVGDNDHVILHYDTELYAYGVEPISESKPTISLGETNVKLVQGMTYPMELGIEVDGLLGMQVDQITYFFSQENIAEVVVVGRDQILIQGNQVGTTTLTIQYNQTRSAEIQIEIVPPKPLFHVTKSKERSFVGDTTELHFNPSFENGQVFSIQSSDVQVATGEAEIEKIDESTYRATPITNDDLSFSVHIESVTGESIDVTMVLPVWEKKLYRFHTLPEQATLTKGQELTLTAFYDVWYEDMEHHDDQIVWEIVEGNDLITWDASQGKSLTIKAQANGLVQVKASVYGSESYTNIEIGGETERFLKLNPSHIQLAPGEQRTLYAQILNGSISPVQWTVQDNGVLKVIKQSDAFIQVEAIINGAASITAMSDGLTQQAVVEVSEYFISMMANPDPIESDQPNSETYFPTEDNEEQWIDQKFEDSYIDGKGSSTILYGRAQGEVDPAYAFHSGIGDQDDLMVKKSESENTVQAFRYAARMRGRRKHQVMIYPELSFQYSIQYKGDLFVTYNESPFKVGIDAYPAKKFEFTIHEERKLETPREYEFKMDITGSLPKKTVEFGIKWQANVEKKNYGDVKDLFTSSAGQYIGGGDSSVWKMDNGFVYETANRSCFSGIMAKSYASWTHYEAEMDFKPIYCATDRYVGWIKDGVVPPNYVRNDGADDDIVGMIFKAKDANNFYCLLWESDQRVFQSWRAGDDLDGFNINSAPDSEWPDRVVRSVPTYNQNQNTWDSYVNDTGWKKEHYRVYKVTNGIFERVSVPNLAGGGGWTLDLAHSMKVVSMGKKTQLFIRFAWTGEYFKVFEFDTDWDSGSFGACNISQAVEFHEIRVKYYEPISGRQPAAGWATFDGVGDKVIDPSTENYCKPSIQALIPAGASTYYVTSVTPEVKDATAGSVTAVLGGALTAHSLNAPNAGEPATASFTKKDTVMITPDQINPSSGLVVCNDVYDLFRTEIAKFQSDHPDLASSSIQPQFTLVKPAMGEPEFQWDQKKLVFWKGEFPVESTDKSYAVNIYAYQGWVNARDLSEFKGGKWAKYTVTFQDNSGTVNPKFDAWQWKMAGQTNDTTNDHDVLMLKTTEWYKGTFLADIHNEGVVNSDQPSYVEIPPNHEHYVDPNDGTPMPGIFANVNVHYLLHKYVIGKQSFVWMNWEGYPGMTTRNTFSPVNAINNDPIIKTDRQNDRVVIQCDTDPHYVPWTSGKYIGYGKVNGKRPFFGTGSGKANMIDVPTDVITLPPNLSNIQGPFIEVEDPRIKPVYDAFKKTANFSSDFQDAYIWFTDWYTDWVEDPRSFHADLTAATEINDTVTINPMLSADYDSNVTVERVEVISDNPFVSTWAEKQEGESHGLLGTYYKYPQITENIREGFVVTGDYHIKDQTFRISEAKSAVRTDGLPGTEVFLPGSTPVRGTVGAKEVLDVTTVYVPEGQSVLKICGSFMAETGDYYPDLQVISPYGECFGIQYGNGTWKLDLISTSTFGDGSKILSATNYAFSGDQDTFEVMTFTQPMQGTWKIQVFNQGIQPNDYCITTNIGISTLQDFPLKYQVDPWSCQLWVNGIAVQDNDPAWVLMTDGQTIHTTAPIVKEDVVRIGYTTGGYRVNELPMQSDFTFSDESPIILSIQRNGIDIPQSDTDGYTLEEKILKIHGSYLTPGDLKVRYAVGQLDHIYTLKKGVGLQSEVYINGVKVDGTKYSIANGKLVLDPSLLHPKDWIHVQSYAVVGNFDITKDNYLGEFVFQRTDPFINFNWGLGSPFADIEPPAGTASVEESLQIMEAIPDQMTFDFNVDCDINYPTSEPIDLSNFTGSWKKWDENIGTDVGDWHGPPEAGYTEVTNLANQSYRSGWYNPSHVEFSDYTFQFKVQERASGDDDMYGAIFRFDPNTFNFYSFEMDAYWSRGGAGGTGVNGMSLFRNMCSNPSQYGTAPLTYTKVRLAHLDEGWTYGADQLNTIQVKVVGRLIKIYVNDIEKFTITDDSPDALLQGAWGPVTCSQPKTYFWDFHISKIARFTWEQDATLRHHIVKQIARPIDDASRTIELTAEDQVMKDEFSGEINHFLMSHTDLTMSDLSFTYRIRNDDSDSSVYFNNDHTVRILELTPSNLQPNPLGKTFIQQAVEKYGNFSRFEKITVKQDIYENWTLYNPEDFDVLTFTPADCNAGKDLIDVNMMNFVRSFKQRGKVIVFTHDTALNPNFETLMTEFGFTIDSSGIWSGVLDKVKPLVTQDWMKYPYDLAHELTVTPAHTTKCAGGTSAYVFSDNPAYAWLRYVGNVFYSETGHSHYSCDGTFNMQGNDNEMTMWINLMMKVATWRTDKSRNVVTDDQQAKIYAEVTTIPATTPPTPNWQNTRSDRLMFPNPDAPIDVYSPDLPEPYINPVIPLNSGSPSDGFAVNWRGNLYAPVSGLYKFHATTDDGFRLKINNQTIINEWHDSASQSYTGSIFLDGDTWNEINVSYYENQGAAKVLLEWTRPGVNRELITSDYLSPFTGYKVMAKVREATPLPWNPMIHNGYYYFQEKEHVLYAKKIRHVKTPVDDQVLVSPRPQQGAALIVRDNEGNNLRKVTFFEEVWDQDGRLVSVVPTLENQEEMHGNGFSKYYLQYREIDADTLVVKLNGVTLNADSYLFDQKKSSVEFMVNLGFDDIMEFRYKLLYSYYVDYNHDRANDVALLVLHSKYEASKMKDMEIIYEGDTMSPFYRAEEVSFNPILNHNHRGFLYITNKIHEQPKSLDINVSPKTLPANGIGKVLVTGKVMDKYNNPIQNKPVDLYRDGEFVFSGPTNRAGEIYFYDTSSVPADRITKYQIACDDLKNLALVHYYNSDVPDRYYLEMKTSKAAILSGQNDEATITMTLRDENWSVVHGQPIIVTFKDAKGVTRLMNRTTNDFGQVTLRVSGVDQQQGVLTISSSFTMDGETTSSFIFLKVIGA
jgi:hypothetical protein